MKRLRKVGDFSGVRFCKKKCFLSKIIACRCKYKNKIDTFGKVDNRGWFVFRTQKQLSNKFLVFVFFKDDSRSRRASSANAAAAKSPTFFKMFGETPRKFSKFYG